MAPWQDGPWVFIPTCPSLLLWTSMTCKFPLIMRTVIILEDDNILGAKVFTSWCHWSWVWRLSRNPFFQRDQNSFAVCWTLLQRLLEYLSASCMTPGGGMIILEFTVRRWLGVSGHRESGSVRVSSLKGPLFITASALHIRVPRDSSLSWVLLLSSSVDNTLYTLLICHSQAPSTWLALGTFILNTIQSQPLFRKSQLPFSGPSRTGPPSALF